MIHKCHWTGKYENQQDYEGLDPAGSLYFPVVIHVDVQTAGSSLFYFRR